METVDQMHDSFDVEVAKVNRYRQAYGQRRAMFALLKHLPQRQIPPGEWTYCNHCDRIIPWQGEGRWSNCRHCGHGFSDIAYVSPSSFHNPVQDYWIRANIRRSGTMISIVGHSIREAVLFTHGFAVPDERTIRKIASFGPVVEMGAGRGYWAYCLNQIGCDCLAYNEDVPPQWGRFSEWSHLFFPVQVGTPQVLREHGDRTLLLVWPPLNDPMGADCLRYWKGRYVCYVGEGYGDCTGDDAFHETLEQCFKLVHWIPMSTWPGVHDSLFIYERIMPQRRMKKRITRIRHHFRKEKIKERNKSRHYRYSSDPMLRRIFEMQSHVK